MTSCCGSSFGGGALSRRIASGAGTAQLTRLAAQDKQRSQGPALALGHRTYCLSLRERNRGQEPARADPPPAVLRHQQVLNDHGSHFRRTAENHLGGIELPSGYA